MYSGETSVYVHPYRLREVFSMDLQKYEHDPVFIFHKSWWTDEGYVQSGLDRETNEKIERLVPFSDIKEVLIGPAWIRMHARSRDSSGKKKNLYRQGLRLVFRVESNGDITYLSFLSETKKDVDSWIQRIHTHAIPAYVTDLDLHDAKREDFDFHYESIIRQPLHEAGLDFPERVDMKNEEFAPPQWKPDSFYKRKEREEERSMDRMKKVRLIVFIGTFLTALIWLPHWRLDEDVNSMFLVLGILVLLFPTYLHNAWKPVQSLLDTVMVGVALFGGLTTANLYTPITAAHYSSIWTTLLIFAVFHNGAFFLSRFGNKRAIRPGRKR